MKIKLSTGLFIAAILLTILGAGSLAKRENPYFTTKFPERTITEWEIVSDNEYKDQLLSMISSAGTQIDIVMYLFRYYKQSATEEIMNELEFKINQGVKVYVILESGMARFNQNAFDRLKKMGANVRYDFPGIVTHTKCVIIDQAEVLLGSHNLSSSSFRYNHESSIYLKNKKLATELTEYIHNYLWEEDNYGKQKYKK